MHRAVLMACLPWLGIFIGVAFAAFLVLRAGRAQLKWRRLAQLHRNEAGAVQSLSFVFTLPIFIMLMMLMEQISQLMIGMIVVHYAAFAAARSAIVWIPADLSRIDPLEGPNCIGRYHIDERAENEWTVFEWEGIWKLLGDKLPPGGMTFMLDPNVPSPKMEKIRSAAILACIPIAPSQPVGYSLSQSPALLPGPVPSGETSALAAGAILQEAYLSLSPYSATIPAVPGRLQNKFAYALNNTRIEVGFFHQSTEPPLRWNGDPNYRWPYGIPPFPLEFQRNELGWQDLVTVKVEHDLALLPGPGRLLAKTLAMPGDQPDRVSPTIHRKGQVYYHTISASAALNIEGEKSLVPYAY